MEAEMQDTNDGAPYSVDSAKSPMQYRNVETSFESDDLSIGFDSADYGGDMDDDWEYGNDQWDDDDGSQSAAYTPFEVDQVTQGVFQQSLNDTPARSDEDQSMKVDSPSTSPELIDLTNTPSVSRDNKSSGSSGEVIDLSESP